MAFYSKPGTIYFFSKISSWMWRQKRRLWCMVPFWDSLGVAMINNCKARDLRIICRPGEVEKYLRKGIKVREDADVHSKFLVGDGSVLLGSPNMTYQSMFDNQENAAYSRGKSYAEFFLSEWRRLSPKPKSCGKGFPGKA